MRPTAGQLEVAYERLFETNSTLSQLSALALDHRLLPNSQNDAEVVPGRSIAWKIFLAPREPLASSAEVRPVIPPVQALQTARKQYTQLLLKKMRAPDGGYEEGFVVPGSSKPTKRVTLDNLDLNNPLSLHNENPWTDWFECVELRKTILQDVERTFPEIDYYRDKNVQKQLTNILFLFSVTHPLLGYRQGMHEILAPIYYAVDMDSFLDPGDLAQDNRTIVNVCSATWIAADAWYLFQSVMGGISRWYEWREATPLVVNGLSQQYVAPIVLECNRIQANLRAIDPVLHTHLEKASLEPTIYGIRWLRLIFTREFSFADSMILWDGIFACDPTFDLAPFICVAMLIRIRNELIPSDYSGQLTALLRYPSTPHVSRVAHSPHHATVLVKQALTLQASPTVATGASIVYENHEFLDIPIQVPTPPPQPIRKRLGHETRAQSASASEIGTKSPMQVGLPEYIARGLLERGESLGLNRNTLMSAVSELRRNLPDLAGTLSRVPSNLTEGYGAFPLDRSTEELSPLHSKFETDDAMTRLRKNNRQLGDSLTWIVDTLLRDETEETDVQRLKLKKREALESLSYVRDVLVGNVENLDEERLLSEEEYRAKKAKAHALAQQSHMITPVISAPPAVANHKKSGSYSRTHGDTNGIPSPNPLSPPIHTFAPWNRSRPSFGESGVILPPAELPRMPPATSTAASAQVPRRINVHSDPLGVLHP